MFKKVYKSEEKILKPHCEPRGGERLYSDWLINAFHFNEWSSHNLQVFSDFQ